MAVNTVEAIVGQARVILQDTISGSYRYSDAELLANLNFGLTEARRMRPDLFIGIESAVPEYSVVDSTALTLDPQYLAPIIYYIVGMAELRDAEDTTDSRAMGFLNTFRSQLLTVA